MIFENEEGNKMFVVWGEDLEIPKYYVEEVNGKLYYIEDYDGKNSERDEIKFDGSIEEFYKKGGERGMWEVMNVSLNGRVDFWKEFL